MGVWARTPRVSPLYIPDAHAHPSIHQWFAQAKVVFPDMMISNYICHEPSKLIARITWPVRARVCRCLFCVRARAHVCTCIYARLCLCMCMCLCLYLCPCLGICHEPAKFIARLTWPVRARVYLCRCLC